MNATTQLHKRLLEMYREISRHGLFLTVDFERSSNAYLITMQREGRELKTRLDAKDAEECIAGVKCVYLGVQIGQFISNFEKRIEYDRTAA
jgi:hypothetical protein